MNSRKFERELKKLIYYVREYGIQHLSFHPSELSRIHDDNSIAEEFTTQVYTLAYHLFVWNWQSQSTTTENSSTGQRYINHRKHGSKVLLFVREFKSDRITGGAAAYTFLGTANYVN